MRYFTIITLMLLTQFAFAQKKMVNKPKSIIKDKGIVVPVYDYKGLKPILENINDTTYIINFWATWCIPCVKELPYFEALLKKYKGQKISVKLVSLDFINKVDKSLIPFLKEKKLQSNVLLLDDSDANTWINLIDPSWSGALPATIIYNKNNRTFYEKSFTFKELENEYLKTQKP